MIDLTDLKYFKLVVGKLTKETKNDCAVNCVACGDKKGRLHLYKNDGMELTLVHCYNAGCTFDDNQMGMVKFLKETRSELVPQYKRERFSQNIDALREASEGGLELDDILSSVRGVTPKATPKTDQPKVMPKLKASNINLEDDDDLLAELEGIGQAVKTPIKTPIKSQNIDEDDDMSFLNGMKLNTLSFNSVPKPLEAKTGLVVPKLFTDMLTPCKSVPEAVKYIENRGLKVGDNWLFSKDKFIKIFDKPYYVLDKLFIPLFQHGKIRGFYTRSIVDKDFATIIFPKGEKYWCSETFDCDKTCYIFEGIFDGMSSGFENVCAMLSADLPQEFLEDLKDPVFCFDNDITGVNKSIKYAKLGYKVLIWDATAEFPYIKDMNERLKLHSIEDNKAYISKNTYEPFSAKILLPIKLQGDTPQTF